MKKVLDRRSGLRQSGALLQQAGDNAFDECDLGVFESLKSPAVKFEAQDAVLHIECGLYHLQDARFSRAPVADRKSTRLNSSHQIISYAVFCLKKKKIKHTR